MDRSTYRFVSRWRVEATCGDVADILGDPLALPRWWPSVYLDVLEVAPADARGLGRRVKLHTKGLLPYTLRWESVVVESRYPHGFALVAEGDLVGEGVWTFRQDGRFVDIVYDWRVRADKPLIRRLSFLLRPVFAANHRWAMAQGEKSLELELKRRRAPSAAAWAKIPPPPGPASYEAAALVAGAAAVGGALVYLLVRSRRKPSD
jgi:hypothetical protein